MKGSVVIVDAANHLGHALVEAALFQGWPTVAVSSDSQALAALRERYLDTQFVTLVGSVDNETQSAALAAALRDLDRPLAGIVIAHTREPQRGRVLDLPAQQLLKRIEADLLPQIAAARHLLPLLAAADRNGSYVVVGSPGSEHPWAGYGHRSIAAAAVNMLVRVLHDEARAFCVRVQLLAPSRPVRTDENRAGACEGWPTAIAIAQKTLALIEQAEGRNSADAVVRFASAPTRASARNIAHAAETPASVVSATSAGNVDSSSQRVLDQTWQSLEPILNSIRENGERK